MDFLFNCPATGQIFETDAFSVTENNGIVTEDDGSRRLDARVVLHNPCPHCGERHVFRADEMICPFEESRKI